MQTSIIDPDSVRGRSSLTLQVLLTNMDYRQTTTHATSLLAFKSGIDVAIWVNGIAENTTHFACRKDDIQRLNDVIQELEDSGEIEKGFCNLRTERLFAPPEKHRTRP